MRHTHLDQIIQQWSPIFMSGDKEGVPVRVYLSAPLSEGKLSKWMQFLLRATNSYGFVHASIQIGPIRFDWFNTSFVKIRDMTKKIESSAEQKETRTRGKYIDVENPLIVFDPLNGKELAKTEANFKKIAAVISDWNSNRMYNNSLANCQDFVVEILKNLGIDFNIYTKESALMTYLKHLRDHPDKSTKWFKDKNGNEIIFDTHQELDEFHAQHFGDLLPDEKALIKCFHRAFQIEEANQQNIPVDQIPVTCPAGPVTLYSKTEKPKPK